jgi:hypothetical protein
MGIWRKRFICSSHRGMRSKGRRIWYAGEEELVWPKASSKVVVFEVSQVYDRTRL